MSRGTVVACLVLVLCAVVASAQPVLLKDVPRTTWDKPYAPVSMLQTALAGMGCPMTYDDLMVASGAAFRMTWRVQDYNHPAIYVYQQDPISTGGAAAGAQVERKQFATVAEAYDAAADSIDQGRPVIAWDSGRVDWQVICGYDEPKQTLFRRTINTGAAPDERPAECLKSPGGGYGAQAAYELWLLTYDRTKPAAKLNWPLILANALRLARWPDADRLFGNFVCGECAYFSWATDLRNSTLHERFPSPGRMSWVHAWMLEKSRRNIVTSLQANAGLHPAFASAAFMYQDEAELFAKAQVALCGGQALPPAEASKVTDQNLKDAKIREACADLIEQALAKDKAARVALTAALKDLAPELLPVEDARPAAQ